MLRLSSLIALASVGAMAFLALYFGASVYFCAGSLKGQIGGCAAMVGGDVLKSTMAQVLCIVSVAGLLFAQRVRNH